MQKGGPWSATLQRHPDVFAATITLGMALGAEE
jgi:hypothetical protein